MNVANIVKGHLNEIFKKEGIEALASERMKICMNCPAVRMNGAVGPRCSPDARVRHVDPPSDELKTLLRQHGIKFKSLDDRIIVHGCGCRLNAKTRVPEEVCPAGKWMAVTE